MNTLSKFSLIGKALVVICLCFMSFAYAEDIPVYKDSRQAIDKRVNDLLSRMTLEEKLAQLQSVWLGRREFENDKGVFLPEIAKPYLSQGIGQLGRPSENKLVHTPNKDVPTTIAFVNQVQKWLLENTRLGIPAIFHEEALHGHAALHATSFPQAIALASTFNPELIQQVYEVSAEEVRRRGAQQVLTPILDVARDPRWGRIEETMGEDPYLVASMGVAAVRGFQGEQPGLIPDDRVIATLKHLSGHGEPRGGLNTAPTPVGERELREIFLYPFEAAVKLAGVRSVMASYNEIDGIPSHANKKMLRDILRDEWGFEGVLISDYFAVTELMTRHYLTDNEADAGALALAAGVDIEAPDGVAYPQLGKLVAEGKLDVALIDQSVSRVLHEKFMLGLFENPFVELDGADAFIGNPEHVALAQKTAEQALVLLKNDKQLLPLDVNKLKSIAVIGPHADETLLGGYSDVPRSTVSVLQGIKKYVGEAVRVNYAQGTILTQNYWQAGEDSLVANSLSKERWHQDEVQLPSAKDTKGMIKAAVKAAKKSDVAIVVVGDNESTSREAWAETHLGDSTHLQLFGEQQQLVDAVLATGTPTLVLLINGRPLAISKIAEQAPAIIEGWYLGQETGTAVARVIFGDVSPSGKLPVSIPRSVGHLPVYYNYKPTAKRGYAFAETSALYPFGHGLSYSKFEYSDLKVDESKARIDGKVQVSFTLKNVGGVAADEVVQLYVRDKVACVTRPVKELKAFARVSLEPQKAAKLVIDLPVNLMAFYDQQMRFVLEPGEIGLMLGSSSSDIRLEGSFNILGETSIVSNKAFLSEVAINP
ncbi:beta-glucosidase [Alteromonadaceae bacterium Bs31]|nr:beta-glucosidase [Alteromonadaceae bacterium Bs31]